MKGYKVFNPDWTCRGFKYEVGKIYEIDSTPILCENGFHFCERAADCFNYYRFSPYNKVAEVEALGITDTDGTKTCTNKIKIVREINWEDVLKMVNIGKNCSGIGNTGDFNSGNYNSGWSNCGDYNTGYCNYGDYNSGKYNFGDYNTGNCNGGNRNTGDHNIGNYNIGDWNTASMSYGCFNSVKNNCENITMFNKPSDWTLEIWLHSQARFILNNIPDNADRLQWWNNLCDNNKEAIRALPNFDEKIFLEILSAEKFFRENK